MKDDRSKPAPPPVLRTKLNPLAAANPNAPGLIGTEARKVWVFLQNILGQFARFAVEQSPYQHPDGLLEVLDAIKGAIIDRFDPALNWAELNWREIEAMLDEAISPLEQVSRWNQRRNGNTSPFVYVDSHTKPDPDNDSIDIGALVRNTALAVYREASKKPPFDLALSARMLEVISEGESDTGKSEAKVNRSEQRRPAPFQMSIPANLPAFQCHKQVRAARIHSIVQSPGGGSWELRLEGQSQPSVVSNDWFSRHSPEVGGYLVAYEDGYTSYSPAAAFEGGYKAI